VAILGVVEGDCTRNTCISPATSRGVGVVDIRDSLADARVAWGEVRRDLTSTVPRVCVGEV
jgi:hypothetical protein